MIQQNVAFIGAGSMAEAIFAGLIKQKMVRAENIYVTNRSNLDRLNHLKETYGVQTSTNKEEILKKADVVILAMKPVGVKDSIEEIRSFTSENQLFLSVLAGITTEYISELLGHDAPVIRIMPNTSAAVGSSATMIAAGDGVTKDQLTIAEELFKSVGMVKTVPEHDIDSLTAIAGSGPAYMYYLVEGMQQSLEELNLDQDLGEEVILQMMQGAIDLMKSTDKSPRELYQNVKSPGGTTEAGLNVLEDNDYQDIIIECIKGAAKRSRDITKELSTVREKTLS
ncbi:pyrroline-5-carboxylate reductase [Alkalihalophilus pseudofirmus OF4]|uniref:Pyrroline-5-carboxylate reductase n=1 Tax=Alkalihalophilus pseudofirmus (strain ATCC BAA-2126 / JCM 17055 / OF4) TaxID=398511 RepID=D3FSQ9_ALKPO|nr:MULTISPECIES: pyrroline-5-carboxylate reductase [Alkalihalophilus]ADC51774.1 pyrroline-5-carboxylate reductase [Alkalihalophilus pseudofirmus OF4]MED1600311.1 pyrroline-5-carboxylate reductase [Alkalihalophilus marmarensis]WEG15378.1 pyrroline-5-carboxylate reductase [Alkalihalophilus pseudofirmus]